MLKGTKLSERDLGWHTNHSKRLKRRKALRTQHILARNAGMRVTKKQHSKVKESSIEHKITMWEYIKGYFRKFISLITRRHATS